MSQEHTNEDLLRSCRRTAWHLEMRDGYMRSDPRFKEWQAGRRFDPDDRESWWSPWLDVMRETTARGVDARRARIVSEPISEYIRSEHEYTFANILVGEQVRWLPRRQTTDLALPGNDFWLFDSELVEVNHFTGEGEWVGRELVTDSAVVKLCTTAFEAVWERAIPHEDYRPT